RSESSHSYDYTCFLFFRVPRTTAISPLSLHDALPICEGVLIYGDTLREPALRHEVPLAIGDAFVYLELRGERHVITPALELPRRDRKSTRLNSSHVKISYAVFCLKKKKKNTKQKI